MSASLNRTLRDRLVAMDGVRKHGPVRRASVIFSNDSIADSIYLLDSGFIKIVRRGKDGKDVLIGIVSPGQLFGELALTSTGARDSFAEVLSDGVLYEVPKRTFVDFCKLHPEMWQSVAELSLLRQHDYEQKISMLCLTDVETRILFYLHSLARVFADERSEDGQYSLPLSQGELASLIGATRETTSTTLNTLARKGLVKLGRRLLTVTSASLLKTEIDARMRPTHNAD